MAMKNIAKKNRNIDGTIQYGGHTYDEEKKEIENVGMKWKMVAWNEDQNAIHTRDSFARSATFSPVPLHG